MFGERERWDQRYRDGDQEPRPPDPFLSWAYETFVSPAFPSPGRALDVAGGLARHSLWLAQQGWATTLVDISAVAIANARVAAGAFDGHIAFRNESAADFLHPELPQNNQQFDLVIVFYFLERTLFPALERAVRPGGFLLYKTFTAEQQQFASGPKDPSHLLAPDELRRAFPGLRVLHYSEIVAQNATAELVARNLSG